MTLLCELSRATSKELFDEYLQEALAPFDIHYCRDLVDSFMRVFRHPDVCDAGLFHALTAATAVIDSAPPILAGVLKEKFVEYIDGCVIAWKRQKCLWSSPYDNGIFGQVIISAQ